MPKNFQTSQYDEPICFDGYLDVDYETPEGRRTFRVGIERAHMEEDTGKNIHVGGATGRIHGADHSLVDYNRAGIPLIEIVTKPIEGAGRYAPEVATAYVSALRDLLRALGRLGCPDGAGVAALRRERLAAPVAGARWARDRRPRTSTRCARWSARCATRSAGRRRCSPTGGRVVQETRHWHEDTGLTTSGRIQGAGRGLPLLPGARPRADRTLPGVGRSSCARRCRRTRPPGARAWPPRWGISDYDMATVVNAGALDLVEATIAAGADQAAARKWWTGELARVARERGVELA